MTKSCCLIVYLRAVIKDSPENIFLDIIELSSQSADETYNALFGVLNRTKIVHDYLATHLVGFTSDGASVMQGINREVSTKLEKRYPQIVLWHCLNHGLELAVSNTLKVMQGVNQNESFFSKVYSVYSQWPKLQRELNEIASDIEVQLRIVWRILTTRWVASSFRAVDSLWQNYPAIYSHFQMLSMSSTDKATSNGLAKKMQTSQFVEDLAVLKDSLGQLSILSESLQKREATTIKASNYIRWTINAQEKIKGSLDTKLSFKVLISDSPVFKGINLQSFQSRRGYTSFNHGQFLQGLVDSMKSRLINNSEASFLCDIQAIIPDKWPSNGETPWLEEENSIAKICDRFNIYSRDIVTSFKEFFSHPRIVPAEFDEKLIQGSLNVFPISSAEAERGFSKMNLICSKMRSSMTIKHLTSLMFVSITGPPVHLWDARYATSKWLQKHKSTSDNRTRQCKQSSISDLNKVQQLFCYGLIHTSNLFRVKFNYLNKSMTNP